MANIQGLDQDSEYLWADHGTFMLLSWMFQYDIW